jgi:hypothetical protein
MMPQFSPTSPYMSVDFIGVDGIRHIDRDVAIAFHAALLKEIPAAVDAVIKNAQNQLSPGHGVDTGLMKATLTKRLITASMEYGIIYSLESDEAPYWVYVEQGFMAANGDWIEGYHFFANAIRANRGRMGRAVAKAWREAAGVLAIKAAVPRGRMKIL